MNSIKHRWNSSYRKPSRKGWYQCKARDDRWNGEVRWRAWGNGSWWIPLTDGWLSAPMGLYQWRGPRKPIELDNPNVAGKAQA